MTRHSAVQLVPPSTSTASSSSRGKRVQIPRHQKDRVRQREHQVGQDQREIGVEDAERDDHAEVGDQKRDRRNGLRADDEHVERRS